MKQKLSIKSIIAVILIISVCIIAFLLFVPRSMSQGEFNEKMDKLVSLLNYDGLSEEEASKIRVYGFNQNYISSIENLVDELELTYTKNWSEGRGFPNAELLTNYVKQCDINRLISATRNERAYHDFMSHGFEKWHPNGHELIYTTIYECFPERFSEIVLNENATTGYYIDNPEDEPGVSRQESYKGSMKDTYIVTHYGDFAVEEAKTWYYDEGLYEWINGEFFDVPGSYKQYSKKTLYYRGHYLFVMESNGKISDDFNNHLIYENAEQILIFEIDTSSGYIHWSSAISK